MYQKGIRWSKLDGGGLFMIGRFFRSKLFVFFALLFILGLVIGYDYALITAK